MNRSSLIVAGISGRIPTPITSQPHQTFGRQRIEPYRPDTLPGIFESNFHRRTESKPLRASRFPNAGQSARSTRLFRGPNYSSLKPRGFSPWVNRANRYNPQMPKQSKHIPEHAWECWYHCMGNTYGTWLPGDSRGFRTRHHRQHIEGDYKNPPAPEDYQSYRRESERNLKHTVVKLNRQARELACRCFCEFLISREIEIAECAVDAVHFHLLAKFESKLVPAVDPGTFGGKREHRRLMIRRVI
jgi:hypothetical protein